MKKLLTFLLTALLAFGVGWAETVTTTISSTNANGTNLVWSNSDLTFSLTQKPSSPNYSVESANNARGLSTGARTGTHVLTSDQTFNNVTKVEIVASTNNAGNTLSVSVGETAIGSTQTIASGTSNANQTYTFETTNGVSGNIAITINNTAKTVWVKTITVTYTPGSTPTGPTIFHKVTSNDEIVANKKYIIVYESDNMFLGSMTTSTSGYGTAVSGPAISGRQVDIDGYDDIAVWTLDNITGSTNLTFSLNDENGYLYAIQGSNEYLCLRQDFNSSNYTKWTGIFDDNGGCTLRNAGATARFIQYNSSGSNFTCASTYVNAYLYVEGEAPALPTAEAPTFDPVSGTEFYGSQTVTITSATSGATIYYTLDGSTPTTSSSSIANGGTVTISSSCTIKAIAVAQGYDNSSVAEATYTKATVPMPTFSPGGGTYDIGTTLEVTISAPDGASVYYTLDGTDPVANRTAYTGPITISSNTTLKAITVINGTSSEVATAEYIFAAPATTCPAEIVFGTESTMTNAMSNDQLYDYITAGDGYVSSISGTQVYYYTDGVRIGSRNNTGSITYNLAAQSDNWRVKKVLVKAASYGDDGVSLKVTTSANTTGVTLSLPSSATTYTDYEFTGFDGSNVTSVTVATTYRRAYIKSITIYYECTPIPAVTITPPTQTISDAAAAELTITGENINGNINASLTTTTDWYLNPTSFGSTGGTAMLTYTGRDLSATNTVTAQASGATDATATVNYVADLWIVTDNGVTGDWHFDGQYGVHMTNNNGVYTADFAVTTPNTFILFARKLGEGVTWNTRYVFGPNSGGDWWLDVSGNGNGTIDTNDDDPIKIQTTGLFTITINANAGTFTITKRSINVTISPEDGTHFTGPSISGTITSDPAGTIEWSTDGTNWQNYTDGFTANVDQVGQSVTVYARSTYNGVVSDVAQATYTRDYAPAPDAPIFSRGSGDVARGTVITITAPEGCTLYVDGQQVNSPYEVTINHSTSISAYCVNDEGTQSATVTNTYTIATVCEASIVFSGGGTTGDGSSNLTGGLTSACFDTTVDENATDGGIIASSSTTGSSGRLYIGKGKYGLKFGSGSYTGSLTINLNTQPEGWQVTKIIVNALAWSATEGELHVTTSANTVGVTQQLNYTGDELSDFANYEFNFDGSEITSFTVSTTNDHKRCYVKSITLVYSCGPDVEAPVITPATGTYYENQSVSITADDGCTIYYTTNGSDPTTSSPVYTDPFNVACTPGSTTTIKAIAVDGDGVISDVATEVYTWAAPTVHIHPDSRNTTASSMSVTLTPDPAGAQVYYTTDGSTPSPANGTLYTGPFTVSIPNVGDAVTVKAIAVMGNTSAVATATYTHVESVLDVNVPFFSPLKDHTYYGDQTLQIGCTTPNADIYYEIVEVSGTTAPSASDVEDPTHVSTHYDGSTIEMTVGNSYYVKAIAYIGNNPSTIAEGWYTILEAPTTQYTYTNLKDFNDKCPTGVTATFLNPVQVVYHSTYTNNGQFAEFCYLRDNTDYACVYFGKRDTNNNTIFKMGDWLDGSQISGLTNIWERNFHIQLGTNAHTVYTWPSQAIGWSEILPEEMTNDVIVAGTSDGDNVWGHYVHLRNTRLSEVDDYSASDPKHTGKINDGTADAYYYDKFYRWSAGTCTYTTGGNTYTDQINCLGDYDQDFFTTKQNAGATFDVYGVIDYYSEYTPPFEMCPIDFLWAYKPQMTPATTTSFEPVTVNITATQPEWAAEGVVIYYKTEDMEEWAVYTGPITVNSTTTIQAYAEVPAEKTDGTNYNDYVRSEIVSETYTIEGIVDPTISPASQVIEVTTGQESLTVTVTDHNEAGSGAVTTYTVNGVEYTLQAGQSVEIVVTETTTVTAVSSIVSGENTLYSNEVSETYDFIEPNGKTYDLLTTNPVVGNIYVIVNKADKVGLSTTQNANNRAGIGVTFTNNNKTVVNGNASLAEFILESANAGRYYFRQVGTQNYLCVTTNEYANLMTGSADVNAEAAATVNSSVTSGVDQSYPATITFYYDGTPRYLRYYSNNRTFTTYGDATANQDVFLYGIEAPELLPPTIDPMSHTVPDGTILNGTVTPDEENPEGALTWYTTDGSDPRTSSTRILWTEDNNGAFTVTETTTVKAVTGYEFGDGYIYSDVVSETYTFVFATTLAWIEREGVVETEYIVANELVGAWAVNNPQDGSKLLWAKDQGNVSIDKRPAKTDDQMDYVKDILQYEWQETWDESNWVILNFANIDADPEDYVGHRITAGTVDGVYTNDGNYEIRLNEAPGLVNDNPQVKDMPLYTGWVEPFPESKLGKNYDLAYNSYVPANFMTENHNHEVNGEVVGFIAGEGALGNLQGDELYFVNPKIQEVAHIWAVWNGNNIFTVYQAEHQENQNINAWNLNGTFRVNWDYNCKSKDSGINGYGEPTALVQGVAYEFHAAIMHPTTNGMRGEVAPQGTPNPGTPSNAYMLYPLDVKDSGTPTAIVEIGANRVAVGVMYYNLVGQQSSKPFEGINIVVTRYSDGSTSAVKVLY